VIHVARLVQFASALLLAYGTSYGPRLSNLVFVYGVALTALMTIAIFSRDRNWLRAVWPPVLGFSLLFVISGFQFLSRPDCESVGSGVACASAISHALTVAAIGLMGGALVVALIDWRRSSVTTA
jgi:hypothetical protein